jgi:DNA-binding transcriptional MerR regulator
MEEISKKRLLTLTGISSGKLYRWKRTGLIPEEWFVKRSVSTGQETFFPRELILARINAILTMQKDHSLADIKDELSGSDTTSYNLQTMLPRLTDMSVQFVQGALRIARLSRASGESLAVVVAFYEAARDMNVEVGLALEEGDLQRSTGELLGVLRKAGSKATALLVIPLQGAIHFALLTSDAAIDVAASSGIKAVSIIQVVEAVEQLRERLTRIERR